MLWFVGYAQYSPFSILTEDLVPIAKAEFPKDDNFSPTLFEENVEINLTDRFPSVLWNSQKAKGNKFIVQAEEGYKISVIIEECSMNDENSYVRISPSKCVFIRVKSIYYQ